MGRPGVPCKHVRDPGARWNRAGPLISFRHSDRRAARDAILTRGPDGPDRRQQVTTLLMNITITPKKSDGAERLLEITVPVETVRDAEERAVRRYASSVRLPGFRPGKAPAAMVRKRFAQAIRQEALEALVQDAYK
jgi:hypothetical protein